MLEGTLELAKTMVGTPYYMSPEIFRNKPYGCCAKPNPPDRCDSWRRRRGLASAWRGFVAAWEVSARCVRVCACLCTCVCGGEGGVEDRRGVGGKCKPDV